jgi:sec-independent protein translocase protein TatB
MEFLNIGGGELLVIVLLAIILFGPEDILRIMRTIGNYTRKIQRMWAQVSAGLKGEFIPDELIPEEIRETIEETKASVDEVKTTLKEVQTTVQTDIDDTKATVKEVKESLREVDTSVKSDMREIPKAMRATAKEAITPKKEVEPAEKEPDPESVQLITALLDDSSGNTEDAAVSETESATIEEGTTPAENDLTPPEITEVAASDEVLESTALSDAGVTDIEETPGHAEATEDESYHKTVAVIASLMEGKGENGGEESESPSDSATDESTTQSNPELTTQTVPGPADVAPISAPEPVTPETTAQDEEV